VVELVIDVMAVLNFNLSDSYVIQPATSLSRYYLLKLAMIHHFWREALYMWEGCVCICGEKLYTCGNDAFSFVARSRIDLGMMRLHLW
jgi:hypothetical protein